MESVTVDVQQLLEVMRENRASHRAHFDKALRAWQHAVHQALERAADEARRGTDFKTYFHLPMPEDHTQDYDLVLGMLEMHTDTEIRLSTREFRQYVNDDWGWKREFNETYNSYVVG